MINLADIETIERYYENALNKDELAAFHQRRASDAEFDQEVVRQKYFIDSIEHYGEIKDLKAKLSQSYVDFIHEELQSNKPTFKNKVVSFYTKYKKTVSIAACIGAFSAIVSSEVISYMKPTAAPEEIQKLSREVDKIKRNQINQIHTINTVVSKLPKGAIVKSGGSAFLIDKQGYAITNAHVLTGSGAILVNKSGQEFKTNIVYIDQSRDLAILKITDKDYKTPNQIPYTISKKSVDLGQNIFTLGFPKNEIVYNTGYLSSESGHDGDTSTLQLSMIANPGNSGGPVFDNQGNIIGVLSTREMKAEGISYAIKANEIYQMIDNWKHTDTSINNATAKTIVSTHSKELQKNRISQIKDLSQYVYLVKVY